MILTSTRRLSRALLGVWRCLSARRLTGASAPRRFSNRADRAFNSASPVSQSRDSPLLPNPRGDAACGARADSEIYVDFVNIISPEAGGAPPADLGNPFGTSSSPQLDLAVDFGQTAVGELQARSSLRRSARTSKRRPLPGWLSRTDRCRQHAGAFDRDSRCLPSSSLAPPWIAGTAAPRMQHCAPGRTSSCSGPWSRAARQFYSSEPKRKLPSPRSHAIGSIRLGRRQIGDEQVLRLLISSAGAPA